VIGGATGIGTGTGGNVASGSGGGTGNGGTTAGTGGNTSTDKMTTLLHSGINLSGAERGFGAEIEESWGPAIPGVEGSTYFWPNPDTNTNVAALDKTLFPGGMNTVRLPFQWERLQPALNADFDTGYLAKMKATAAALRSRGSNVLLDVHNYAYYKVDGRGTAAPGQLIGSPEVPITAFADFWRRMAVEFGAQSQSSPYIFGLMNEPHDIDTKVWISAAQAAVDAIRTQGAKNLIFVPGSSWTTAADFSWDDNATLLQSVTDPIDNFAIEVHQYYDGPCTTTGYVDLLSVFENWARTNHRVAFLGEMGLSISGGDTCLQAFANLVDHLQATAAGTANGVWVGYTFWLIDSSSTTSGAEFVSGGGWSTIQPRLPSTCASGAKDGNETDVDCGGTCRRCGDGKACSKDYDCQSGFCAANKCGTTGP
jgi:endoglucanase